MYTAHSEYASQSGFLPQSATHSLLPVYPCAGKITYSGAGRQTKERNERRVESCSGRAGKTERAFSMMGMEGIGYYPDMQPGTDGDDSV